MGAREQVVYTMCTANCGGRSRLECTVRGGRLVKVGVGPHPDSRYTAICARCLTMPQWVYSAERIRHPMRRVGPRGAGEFERISWDEALDEIAAKLKELKDEHGGESIAFNRTSGASQMGNFLRLAALLGASNFYGGVDMAVHMGLNTIFGYRGMFGQNANEWTDRVNAKLIIVWGNNPADTSTTSFHFLKEAQEQGSQMIVIDTRYSTTAMHADWWVAPRPGTDLALALGMLQVIIAEGLVDREFTLAHSVAPLLVRDDTRRYLREADVVPEGSPHRYMVWDSERGIPVPAGPPRVEIPLGDVMPGGGESSRNVWADDPKATAEAGIVVRSALAGQYRVAGIPVHTAFSVLAEAVAEYPPERVQEITGLPARDVRDLAVAYATEKPATIGFGYGVDRHFYADMLTRAAGTLAVLTGNLGKPGAGVGVQSHGTGTRGAVLANPIELPEWAGSKSVPNIEVGARSLPVRAQINQGDFLNQRVADLNRVLEWVKGLELFVTIDHFWQTSSLWSDIVLPASTFLESTSPLRDLTMAGNSLVVRPKVIDPVGESRPDDDIERDLAERLGYGDYYRESTEELIRRQIEESSDPAVEGITLERLLDAGGALRLNVPETPQIALADLHFPTPTGRAEFYAEDLIEFGEELPVYKTDFEAAPSHPKAERYPLVFLQSHARQRAHSTFFNSSWMLEIWPEPIVELNPDDAAARSLVDGDYAEVFNDRGRVVAKAVLNPDYPPGVCNMSEGWKQQQFREGNLQELTNPRINLAQQKLWTHANISFYDTRVDVRSVEAEETDR